MDALCEQTIIGLFYSTPLLQSLLRTVSIRGNIQRFEA